MEADCGACDSTTDFACANKNTVQLCENGVPTKASFSCPRELVCVSSLAYPCQERPTTYDCQEKCSEECAPVKPGEGPFSIVCTGVNTLMLCDSEGSIFNSTCPAGEVCTAANGCAPSNSNSPACTMSDITTTTPITTETAATTITSQTTISQAPLTPDEICAGKPNQAKYPLSPPDPFCER